MKSTVKVFLQKDFKKFWWHYMTTVNHLTDSRCSNCHQTSYRGIQLLPAGLSAPCFTAKPLSFDVSNGQTVYNYTLYKKQEKEKAVAKHRNGFEPTIRGKARAQIRTGEYSNRGPRRNRYSTRELSAIQSIAFII